MADLHALGPIGFRGPAADSIPAHLTVTDHGIRTVQLISPGDACPSNALVGDVLDLIGEDVLYITSANTSSHVSKHLEAAHYEMREIQREFGQRPDVTLIGHRNERAIRRSVPAPPAVLDVDRRLPPRRARARAARLARRGHDRQVAARHGLTLTIADGARERVPVRRASRVYRRPVSSGSRLATGGSGLSFACTRARRRGRLTLISWARK